MIRSAIVLFGLLAVGPAIAESHDPLAATGDIEAGAAAFARQCVACHVVVNDAGEKLAGKNGKTGPNLFGVAGRTAGSVEGYRYGKSMLKAGSDEIGLVWNEATFGEYVRDPTKYLRKVLDDRKARGRMTFKVKTEKVALDLYAFLHSLAPPVGAESNGAATN